MPLVPHALFKRWKPARPLRALPMSLKALAGLGLGHPLRLRRQPGRFPGGSRVPIKSYGSIGSLEVRLAQSRADVRAAQRLRYRVFFEEMSATASVTARVRRRDQDAYDPLCDHLLVIESGAASQARAWKRRPAASSIVGTYRILRQAVADRRDGFYSQGEFNIEPLLAAKANLEFMELGRSCVLASHRNKRTIELLWHGLWTYVREHGIDVMIGCASFEGTDPQAHAMALSYLHHAALAPQEWRVRAHELRRVPMDMVPADRIDAKAALRATPPLIKGYLRLGAYIGDGAVVDVQFGTTDVLVVLPVERIDPRYFARFGAPDELTSRIRAEARGVM